MPYDRVASPPASFLVGSLSARSGVAGVCGPGEGACGFFPLWGLASPSLPCLPRGGPHSGGRCLTIVGPLLGLASWCRASRSRAQVCLWVRAAGWSCGRAVPPGGHVPLLVAPIRGSFRQLMVLCGRCCPRRSCGGGGHAARVRAGSGCVLRERAGRRAYEISRPIPGLVRDDECLLVLEFLD